MRCLECYIGSSMSKAAKEIRTAVSKQQFAPVYYINGDDEYGRELIVRELVDGAADAATRDFNVDLMRADVGAEQLQSILYTPPMMAARRVVVLRDPAALKKESRQVLEQYIKQPSGDVVLVMVAPLAAKSERWLEEHAAVVTVAAPTAREVRIWMVTHAMDVHQTTLTDEAAALLESAVGNDTTQIAAELDKLASYVQGAEITAAAVTEVVGVTHSDTVSGLLDAIARRDAAAALAMCERVLSQPKVTVVSIIMALSVQVLAMTWGRQARSRGLSSHHLEREYFALLKETGAFPMRPWGEAVKCWSSNLSHWTSARLAGAAAELRRADMSAKDTRLSSDEQLLSNLIYSLCGTPAGSTS